ncbi:MAG TPA: ATP-binding cassette domain-containing protein [Sediminibacterium sp.]|uniref:ABC transporter ATP-binding protein n=1 Tax=Sediminibacterium sp. TaxID=1917865 RepID=UPI0026839DEB|nr:ATP-binding cassette domain-containing protein [Sediminibacterium sp.]HQS25485.1 ATP-binding cassette domain-containing protein [Sediminibacterium sp.]HQS36160.1 ATP-binding cassette domain-containing protein [Sediminibacterium sp.]
MMNNYFIELINCGKKFNREWIFRRLNYQFNTGQAYAITGHNGSGKSTLLQCIAGNINFNEGDFKLPVDVEKHFQHISICTPYLELIEEMSGIELLAFHNNFKPLSNKKTIPEILALIGLGKTANKQISKFSSGMKQRLKLAQAIFSDTPVLLLDEPCTNLDKEGYALYQTLIQTYCNDKIVIICSNEEAEIHFCSQRIHINDYK